VTVVDDSFRTARNDVVSTPPRNLLQGFDYFQATDIAPPKDCGTKK